MITENQVVDALQKVYDPELRRTIVELNMIRDLKISPEGNISFTMALTIPGCPMKNQMQRDAEAALKALQGAKDVSITFGAMSDEDKKKIFGASHAELPKLNSLNEVKKVIAVMSGKGGVGKSSVTSLLACTLKREGKKVGILDADITGPSIPKLFSLPAGGLRKSEQGLLPAVTGTGIRVMSTNLLVPNEDDAVIWRGPMIGNMIQQFWRDTLWGKLDVLLVDMPPGTSDAAITVAQSVPLNGVVLVTSPQLLAGMVVKKASAMLKQLNVPVLAVVENMSRFQCPDCGKQHEIFGPSHSQDVMQVTGAPLLVTLPIDPRLNVLSDAGKVEEYQTDALSGLTQLL
jgi:ATP-binding protein involved in chromosome partitioning